MVLRNHDKVIKVFNYGLARIKLNKVIKCREKKKYQNKSMKSSVQ